MSINAVGYSPANYATKMNASKQNVAFAGSEKTDSSKGKKIAKGFASFAMTGLGQMCDGRFKDGFKQLGTNLAFGLTALAGYAGSTVAKSKVGQIASVSAIVAGILGSLVTRIYSIVDAYKGSK